MSNPSIKLFIAYARKDKKYKDELIKHLAVLRQEGEIEIWHDEELTPGDEWQEAIEEKLRDADIVLYLVSASSLKSDQCNYELSLTIEEKKTYIPIILKACDWKSKSEISDIQALPEEGKPISSSRWKDKSEAWQNVTQGIRKAVKKARDK